MRMLDEVIAYFDNQTQQRHVYLTEDAEDIYNDALHYLQEYQGLSKMWNDKLDKEQENPPLDWETLKQMEGKPVWIEFLNDEGEWNGEWCLVENLNNILCEILRCKMSWWGLRKITLGKTWQAYRKENNGR